MFILSFVMFGECLVLYAHVNSDIKTIFHTGTRRSSQLHANLASFTGQHRIHAVNCVREFPPVWALNAKSCRNLRTVSFSC